MNSQNWWEVGGWPLKTSETEGETPATHLSSVFFGLHHAMQVGRVSTRS